MSFPKYAIYKDSGVRWLGSAPDHWTVKALKHVFRVVGGSTPKSEVSEYWDGAHVWVTPADLSGLPGFDITESSRSITTAGLASCGSNLVPTGSIVLSTRAPIGSLAIAGTSLCTNQGCKSLVAKGRGEPRFYAYLLSVAGEELNLRGRGTTFLELSADALGAFEVVEPTTDEQVTIVEFLDCETAKIDALVDEQKRLIGLLKEKRQAVISQAVTKGLDPDVPMKDSGVEWLGKVPAHWDMTKLKHLVVESVAGPYGASLTKDMYTSSGYRVYGQQQVIPDDFTVGDYYISEAKFGEMRRYSVYEGDVLVSVMGTIGKVAVVPGDAEPGIINPRLVRYKCSERIRPRYLQRVLLSQKHQEHLLFEAKGTTMDGLNMSTLGNVPVPVPPLAEQAQIVEWLSSLQEETDALVGEAEKAAALLLERRSALISAAVTGKIDVRQRQSEPA